jgi:N-acetylmuramoyl-L-alanine amidase
MKRILGLTVLATTAIAFPAWSADKSLYIAFPPTDYKTTSERIFLLGTAPSAGEVLVNGKAIARSGAGHFAPSFPLQLGDNLFTVRYQNQEVEIKVKRLSTQPQPPTGLAFGKDSLTPNVDIARLPGELICFGAIAPPNANVSVVLANQTILLLPQSQQVQLPANSAALTQQNQPSFQSAAGDYKGCAISVAPANLGQPQFQLTMNGSTTRQLGSGKISVLSPAHLEIALVSADSGVARTGPSTDYSRLTPLPKGTRAAITGREGKWLRLDYGGWINSNETRILPGSVPPRSLIRSIVARQVPGNTEVMFPLQVPVPVSVQQGDRTLTLTLYNTTAQTDVIHLDDDPVIFRLDWQQVAPTQVQYIFNLKSKQQWGYKLRYDGTTLVLSLRHSPRARSQELGVRRSQAAEREGRDVVSPERAALPQGVRNFATEGCAVRRTGVQEKRFSPLSGIKILLDPGHGGTDSGTTGPTGMNEKQVTLIMAKLVREQLISRGASVYLTREQDKSVSLQDRVAMIDKLEPAIAVSLHYNSLPDDGDAQGTQGLGAFWYNAQAHSLAVFLHNYIVNKLGRHKYGVFWDNLALTRPTTAPAVLLELGFMSNPVEFEWVMNPEEQKKLAGVIADAITQWFSIYSKSL